MSTRPVSPAYWLRYTLSLGLVITLLFACRSNPAPAAPDTPAHPNPTDTIGAAGGDLQLTDGTYARFETGFFSADSKVSLSSFTPLLGYYPQGVAEHFPVDRVEAVGPAVELELPYPSLTRSEATLHLNLPITSPLSEEADLRAEVFVKQADGQELFYLEDYAPTSDTSGGLQLTAAQLGAGGTGKTVQLIVRPIVVKAELASNALPSGFIIEDVVSGLNQGVAFDFAAGGRIFIAEKGGAVKVVQNGTLLAERFVDISGQVNNRADRGLLGIAVHPDFPAQPYVYLLFTYDPPQVNNTPGDDLSGPDGGGARVSRLIRLTADASANYNKALADSEVVLLGKNSTWANIGNPAARNDYSKPGCVNANGGFVNDCLPGDELSHSIGTVKFGTDGSLFVGSGDGCDYTRAQAACYRAQNLSSLSGKLLRIDPLTGQGLADNPFYNGNANANRSKVYAYGLRNPFRFTVDTVSGEPYIGDVGWSTWEEVNRGRGANFGWPCYEGGNAQTLQQGSYAGISNCQTLYNSNATLTPSVYGYVHVGGSSIQVGDFYRGTSYPSAYRNALFMTDFNQRWIKYIRFDNSGNVQSVNDFGSEAGVTQTSSGPDSNLYLMNIYEGKLKRVRYVAGGNNAPTAVVTATPTSGNAPLQVSFSSDGTFDPDGDSLSYAWTFGDGGSSSAPNPVYTYTANGTFSAQLTVTDSAGTSDSATISISTGNALPTATITSPSSGTRYNAGDTITFSGTGTDPEDGSLAGSSFSWQLNLNHNEHQHFDELPPTSGSSGSFSAPDHGDNTSLELCLTVTDSDGATDTDCVLLAPNTVAYTLDTVPSGLQLSWEGVERTTPFTVNTVVGSSRQLIASATQGNYSFTSWSDGGSRIHNITVGNSPRTFVASYSGSTCGGLTQEAETAARFGKFAIGNDTNASGGQYVAVPLGEGSRYSFGTDDRVEFCVNIATAGTYRIKGFVRSVNDLSDSFFVTVDGAPATGYIWDTTISSTYLSNYVSDRGGADPVLVNLSAGQHTIAFQLREDGTRLDKITLEPAPSNDPPTVSSPGNRNNSEGDTVYLTIGASDPEGDTLSYSATGLPPGLSIGSTNGRITGKLATGSAGTYTVTVTVSDGQSAGSTSFTWQVSEAPTGSCGGLTQEAENASRFGNFVVVNDSAASGGKAVTAPTGSGTYYGGPNGNHRIDFCVTISAAGVYQLEGTVRATSVADDSFFVAIDGAPAAGYIWDVPIQNAYVTEAIAARSGPRPIEVTLSAGEHIISFYQREENTRLDKLSLKRVDGGTTGPCGGLSQEAETGTFYGVFTAANDTSASGGAFVHAPPGSGFAFGGPDANRAVYCVTVTDPGNYRIRAVVKAADTTSDSFFVTIDDQPTGGYLWDVKLSTVYTDDFVSDRSKAYPVIVNLAAGEHDLAFYLREPATRLDKFVLERVGN